MTDSDQFVLPNDQPVVELDCTTAFNCLTTKEKLYAHYLSQASWNGGLVVLVQTSPESPLIFVLLHKLFSAQSIEDLKKAALEDQGITEDEFQAVLVYTSGILTNSGNYKGFGDSKFVPNLPASKFEAVIKCSEAFRREPKVIQSLWDRCKDPMYLLKEDVKCLGFRDKGMTTYYSSNCSLEDVELVSQFMKEKDMDFYNNRVFKTEVQGTSVYEVRLASVETGSEPEEKYKNCKFHIAKGDYSKLLERVVQNLLKAKEYSANETEKNMLHHYAESFQKGTLNDHKEGSRYWIRNKGPVVETYIGFIETYRDPAGMRGEFEGFVAMVNKEMSAKFARLVESAEILLPELPWPAAFEKDKFLRPDFTSLDVLTFSGSGIPAGINIPNYDEIRQNEGFKNVSLGNVIPASYKTTVMPFLTEEDKELLTKYRVQAFEVQVGLHELLGHGSGKLFYRRSGEDFNFDVKKVINPLDGQPIKTWYEDKETYDSKFTTMGSSYEECRAECVGLYLSLNEDVLKIFGYEGKEAEDVMYVNWLSLLYTAVGKALEMYQPSTKAWLQAHSQARYVILRVILEAGGDLITINETSDGKDLLMKVDRSKLKTIGKKAVGDFLLKLQVYKSTGDITAATEMYDKLSEVPLDGPHPWGKWRDIVMANKQPRKMFVQANTFLKGTHKVYKVLPVFGADETSKQEQIPLQDRSVSAILMAIVSWSRLPVVGGSVLIKTGDDVTVKTYDATHEGLIQSFVERFQSSDIDVILEELWEKDQKHY